MHRFINKTRRYLPRRNLFKGSSTQRIINYSTTTSSLLQTNQKDQIESMWKQIDSKVEFHPFDNIVIKDGAIQLHSFANLKKVHQFINNNNQHDEKWCTIVKLYCLFGLVFQHFCYHIADTHKISDQWQEVLLTNFSMSDMKTVFQHVKFKNKDAMQQSGGGNIVALFFLTLLVLMQCMASLSTSTDELIGVIKTTIQDVGKSNNNPWMYMQRYHDTKLYVKHMDANVIMFFEPHNGITYCAEQSFKSWICIDHNSLLNYAPGSFADDIDRFKQTYVDEKKGMANKVEEIINKHNKDSNSNNDTKRIIGVFLRNSHELLDPRYKGIPTDKLKQHITSTYHFPIQDDRNFMTENIDMFHHLLNNINNPTIEPNADPADTPTIKPNANPTAASDATPPIEPNANPTAANPTIEPNANPTDTPTIKPNANPADTPPIDPNANPADTHPIDPNANPTAAPADTPPIDPTADPTIEQNANTTTNLNVELKSNSSFAGIAHVYSWLQFMANYNITITKPMFESFQNISQNAINMSNNLLQQTIIDTDYLTFNETVNLFLINIGGTLVGLYLNTKPDTKPITDDKTTKQNMTVTIRNLYTNIHNCIKRFVDFTNSVHRQIKEEGEGEGEAPSSTPRSPPIKPKIKQDWTNIKGRPNEILANLV